MGEVNVVGSMISISILVGIILGAIIINSRFEHDTYDCTVKCPNNSHSIYVNEKCYCEIK